MGIRTQMENEPGVTRRDYRVGVGQFDPHRPPYPLWPDFMNGQPDRPVRVLLVDDDHYFRRVVAQELNADLRIQLVAQAGSAREGNRLIAQHEFDVMMIDLNLGDGSGFDLVARMKLHRPAAEAVVISAIEDQQNAIHAFELGATGYLLKSSWFGSFSEAILQVVNGGAFLSPSLARQLLCRLDRATGEVSTAKGSYEPGALSVREREVLKMVAGGFTSAEIGIRLVISCQTVNTHVKSIYRKLQVRNRAQAVSLAGASGLL